MQACGKCSGVEGVEEADDPVLKLSFRLIVMKFSPGEMGTAWKYGVRNRVFGGLLGQSWARRSVCP